MFTLDDMMNINDNFLFNFDYTGHGLGYKPTKYNMVGGTIEEKEPKRIHELMQGDVNDMEKVLRAYNKARDKIEIGEDYDNDKERQKDLNDINKNISSIERKIERKTEQNEGGIISEEDEIKEQMNYYEENLDSLTEQEYEEYIGLLAYLHEKEPDKKDKEKILDIIKDTVDLLDKKTGKYHEEYREDFLSPFDIENMIKDIKINEGYGKRFEKVLIQIQDKIKKALTNDNSLIINNDTIDRYKKHLVDTPLAKDNNGKVLKWGKKPLSDYLVFDLSQDKNDIEVKYYNVGSYKPTEEKIKKEGLILQQSKFVNTNFYPLYTLDENNNAKLYNIYSKRTNDWVNEKSNKDVHILYQTSSGNYTYHLNNDKDLKRIKHPLKGDKGEELYILQPTYNSGYDNYGEPIYNIPFNKLKKIYL